jgi:hypothetical protein
MHPVALGRWIWIQIGSAPAGPKIAAILSVVESCRRLKFPVRDYPAAVLPGLADCPIQRLPELTPAAPKPSPTTLTADVAIGVPPASFSSADKTAGRSRRSQPPVARSRQPLISTKMKLRTKIHLSSPTANTFSTSPISCLNPPESNWECLANPNKAEPRLPQAIVRRLHPIISCLSAPDTFRPNPSIRAPSRSRAILRRSAKPALSPSLKTAFSPTTRVPPSPSSGRLTEAET